MRRFLPLLVLLLGPTATAAQDVPSPYRFIAHNHAVGVYLAYLDADAGEVGVGPRSGIAIGAQYAMEVSDPLAVEGSLFLLPTDRAILNPARDPGDLAIGEADVTLVGLTGGVRFNPVGRRTWKGFAPYGVARAGLALDLASDSEVEDELQPGDDFDFGTSFLAEIGAGTRWFPSDRWNVLGEATLHLWQVDTPPGFLRTDRDHGPLPEDEWIGALKFSFGVSYRF